MNVTIDDVTDLQRAGMSQEQLDALSVPSVVDPRSDLVAQPGSVSADEVDDEFVGDAPAEHLVLPDADPDGEDTGAMPVL